MDKKIFLLIVSFGLFNVAMSTKGYGGSSGGGGGGGGNGGGGGGGSGGGGYGGGGGDGGDYGHGEDNGGYEKLDGGYDGGNDDHGYGGQDIGSYGHDDYGYGGHDIKGYGHDDHGYGGYDMKGYGHSDHGGHYGGHSISAAILSHHSVKSIPVHSSGGHGSPTLVDVDGGVAPIVLNIKSRSSPVIPQHKHYGHGGSFKKTFSSDKPHKLVHVVTKPVIHELKEVIMPYRRHTQKVKPVRQSIQTYVHHGKHGGHY